MADYKDILHGTINSIVSKVKEADIPGKIKDADIPGKVKGVMESAGVYEVYEKGADRAKAAGKAVKLTLEMNGESEELKRVYAEIGKLYYQQNRENPQGVYAPLIAQADELIAAIMDKDEKVKSMKEALEAEMGDRDIDVEICNFEDIVDATENNGSDSEDK